MSSPGARSRVWSLITLHQTRSLLLGMRYRVLVGLIALAYAFGAMVFGGMVYFPTHPLRTGWFFYIYPTGPGPSWAYPLILAGGPNFELGLPFISAVLVTLSAAGVGLGMALAVFLGVRLLRRRGAVPVRPGLVGSATGLTPALIALLTLGACCSTTAAATAGISLAAQASGTTPAEALAHGWYLGVFQVAVIYVALVAQEQLLRVYGWFFGGASPGSARSTERGTPARRGRREARAVLRIVLVVAGLTWALSMLTDWFTISPGRASAATWLGWLLLHEVPGVLAVLVGVFPAETLGFWTRHPKGRGRSALRGALLVSGLALLTWMRPPLSGAGAAALGNELLGFGGFPAGWGAVVPPELGLVGLSLRWGFQFVLLGLVTVAIGVAPETTLRLWFWPSASEETVPKPDAPSREPAPPRPESA